MVVRRRRGAADRTNAARGVWRPMAKPRARGPDWPASRT